MITRYSHNEHYPKLVKWLAAKNMPAPDPECFSEVGFCIEGNAIGFLVQTDSRQCYFDHVAANPELSKEERSRVLDTLFRVVEAKATQEGYKLIVALAELPSMKERFLEHRYRPYRDFTLFFKLLGDKSCLS